jgi:hypothetical protein
MSTFSAYSPKGTIGYTAAIDRPSRSKAQTCRTIQYPTRAAAVEACLESIDRNRVRVKPADTITTHEWTATGDSGGWTCELSKLLERSHTQTIAAARAAACLAYADRHGLPVVV